MSQAPKKPSSLIGIKPAAETVIEHEDSVAPKDAQGQPLRDKRCETCGCGYFTKTEPSLTGSCRRDPPEPQIFLLPPMPGSMQPQIRTVSDWPPVGRDQFCVDGYRPKDTGGAH